jgi:hypothetical protein
MDLDVESVEHGEVPRMQGVVVDLVVMHPHLPSDLP